jgi:hypothetical protein
VDKMITVANSCAVCSTHRRPADVPWQQHHVGCPVRECALCPTDAPSPATAAPARRPLLKLRRHH